MYKRHMIGKEGEEVASQYLLKKQYKIIGRNFKCRQGEIDIIAKEGKQLVFIEVKTRSNAKYGLPIEAVTYVKRKHILKAIEYYIFIKKCEMDFIRIDVIEVYKEGEGFRICHIRDAFGYF